MFQTLIGNSKTADVEFVLETAAAFQTLIGNSKTEDEEFVDEAVEPGFKPS